MELPPPTTFNAYPPINFEDELIETPENASHASYPPLSNPSMNIRAMATPSLLPCPVRSDRIRPERRPSGPSRSFPRHGRTGRCWDTRPSPTPRRRESGWKRDCPKRGGSTTRPTSGKDPSTVPGSNTAFNGPPPPPPPGEKGAAGGGGESSPPPPAGPRGRGARSGEIHSPPANTWPTRR